MTIKTWRIEELTGYKPLTTFYEDFSIADMFWRTDSMAVKETYKRCFESWKHDYKYLTELCMAINWKIWEHVENNPGLAEQYQDIWEELDAYCCTHLKGEELKYFYQTTD